MKFAPESMPFVLPFAAAAAVLAALGLFVWAAGAAGLALLVLVDTSARLAGYATFRQLPDAWELLRLAVAPERRRAGLGRRLLREGLRRLGGAGERFCLEVREDNVAACQLYETEEFRRVGRRPGYYRDGTAALLYARESAQR